VTWMRLQDFHILTVGQVTYTADDRFQVTHVAGGEDWTLHLRGARVADTGAYVCQVNARPRIARRVYLTVTDKEMLEGLLTHPSLNQGHLHTHIPGRPPSALAWYRGGALLLLDNHGGRLSLQVEREGTHTTSRLHLGALTPADAGTYTCVPVGGGGASVSVHVTQDERRAAVQWEGLSGGEGRVGGEGAPLLLLFLLLLLLLPLPLPSSNVLGNVYCSS
ncbi:hypothetical protein O3P69_013527, partial [Scylla paramamosain]